jgi:GNAT superfamily N-acetyltransferase
MTSNLSLSIRPAVPHDAALVFSFVAELAAFEHLSHELEATEAMLAEAMFSAHPRVFGEIAEYGGESAGFSLWFYTFSSFRGRHGIWVEDLYVRKNFRGKGIGGALLANIARRCVEEKLGRLEWSVLDWNENAIRFYEAAGARVMEEWRICRLVGKALSAFAVAARRN